jgi:hypothetical protein
LESLGSILDDTWMAAPDAEEAEAATPSVRLPLDGQPILAPLYGSPLLKWPSTWEKKACP